MSGKEGQPPGQPPAPQHQQQQLHHHQIHHHQFQQQQQLQQPSVKAKLHVRTTKSSPFLRISKKCGEIFKSKV